MKHSIANNSYTRVGIGVALLLLLPFVAMQITDEVNWDVGDFVVMGLLLFGAASLYIRLAKNKSNAQRLAIGTVCVAGFLYVWAELSVGIFFGPGN